jgi:hypothetical protein
MKTQINFSCHVSYSSTDQKYWTVFKFYPNGMWDECKWTLVEALKHYPLDKYDWVFDE